MGKPEIRRIGYGARMNISEERNYADDPKISSDCPCFCIRRILCSPNRVSPLPPETIAETTESGTKSPRRLVYSPSIPIKSEERPEAMQEKKEKRVKTPRTKTLSLSSPPPRRTPVQQSQSSHAFPSAGEEDIKAPRPTTKVMNKHPSVEEIATLPHISANKALSELNISATKPESQGAGFRLGGRIILPPLPTSRKGADGDTTKHSNHKSLIRKKSDPEKTGDNGSGERVIQFSLPAISNVDSIELRNQNPVVRKGGMAYDLIIPSQTKSHYPSRNLFSPINKPLEAAVEKETELQNKLEKAEKRGKSPCSRIRKSD